MIVITAPTSMIGQQVIANLLTSGQLIRVVARDPSRIPAPIRACVEIVQGSHSDIDVVNRAFTGAEAVFWLVPPDPQAASVEAAYSGFTRPACDAFRRQGVRRVVGVSALGRGSPLAGSAGYVTASLAMDDLIASTGVSYRALTLPSFMDNILRQIELIKHKGVFFSPTPEDLKAPTCATRDIATVAANLLLDSSWRGQGEVPVLGPEDLSFNDMAHIMSDVLGKPVRFQQVPFDAFKTTLAGYGMSEAMTQGVVDMMVAKSEGLDNAQPRTAQATSVTSFRQWCMDVLRPILQN